MRLRSAPLIASATLLLGSAPAARVDDSLASAPARDVHFERERVAFDLPAKASDPAVLASRAGGVSVRIRAKGARAVAARASADGSLSFANALADSEDAELSIVPRENGFEDFVRFPSRPASREVRYEIEPSPGSGLRLVEGVLEIVDPRGAPRLRMARPWIRDARGREHELPVRVEGCAVDADPRAPWGRAPLDPGSNRCEIVISFRGLDLEYPALLDPAWFSTTEMASIRARGAICRLLDGRVLVAGGIKGLNSGSYYAEAELFDPETETWADTASMAYRREASPCVVLPDGRAIVAGGRAPDIEGQSTAELYDPVLGTWSERSMVEPRADHTLTLLADGRVLAAGGVSNGEAVDTTETFDTGTDTWTTSGTMTMPRSRHAAALLPGGDVLIISGDGLEANYSSETYEPGSEISTSIISGLHEPHIGTLLLPLGAEFVAIAGEASGGFTGAVDAFDPQTRQWRSLAELPTKRKNHVVAALPSGRLLVAGGYTGNAREPSQDTFAYNPEPAVWLPAGSLDPRIDALAISLDDGRVLMAGGLVPPNLDTTNSASLFVEQPLGAVCKLAGICASGECWDYVCCDTYCGLPCQVCTPEGTCEVLRGQDDPDLCAGSSTCSDAGECKGAPGSDCSDPADCASGFCIEGTCCDRACGSQCEACDEPASRGTCSLVVGAPRGARPACDEGTICNGKEDTCAQLSLCEEGHVAIAADGTRTDCSPYACAENGACRDACVSFADCAEPYLCDTNGQCVTPNEEPQAPGCSVATTHTHRAALTPFALAALAAALRRRRNPSRPASG